MAQLSSVDDVCAWLQALGLRGGEKYIEAVKEKGVDGAYVLAVPPSEFLSLIGVSAVGHKLRIEKALAVLRGEARAPEPETEFGFFGTYAPDESVPAPASPSTNVTFSSALVAAPLPEPAPTLPVPGTTNINRKLSLDSVFDERAYDAPMVEEPIKETHEGKEKPADPARSNSAAVGPGRRSLSSSSIAADKQAAETSAESLADRLQGPPQTRDWVILKEGLLLKVRRSLGRGVRPLYVVLRQHPTTLQAVLEFYEGYTFKSSFSLEAAKVKPCPKAVFVIGTKTYSITLKPDRDDVGVAAGWVLALQQAANSARGSASITEMLVPQTGYVQAAAGESVSASSAPAVSTPPPLRTASIFDTPATPSQRAVDTHADKHASEPGSAASIETASSATSASADVGTSGAGQATGVSTSAPGVGTSVGASGVSSGASVGAATAPSADDEATWRALQAAEAEGTSALVSDALQKESERQAEQRAKKQAANGVKSAAKQRSNIMKTSYMSNLRSQYHFIDQSAPPLADADK